MAETKLIVLTPPGRPDPSLAIAACRAGGLGVLDLEYTRDARQARESIQRLALSTQSGFGVKCDADAEDLFAEVFSDLPENLRLVLLTCADVERSSREIESLHRKGLEVLLECRALEQAMQGEQLGVAGVIAKGSEGGGRIGRETTFVLLERLLSSLSIPVWAQGGIGLFTGAACCAAGAAGIVLDAQVALASESSLPDPVKAKIAAMEGNETLRVGGEVGETYRICSEIAVSSLRDLQGEERRLAADSHAGVDVRAIWRRTVCEQMGRSSPEESLLLFGQDAVFAAQLADRFVTVGGILEAMQKAIDGRNQAAREPGPPGQGSGHGKDSSVVSIESRAKPSEIAVVGMGCFFPGASDPQRFWERVLHKVNAVTVVPRDRWDWKVYCDEKREAKDRIYAKWGAFLEEIPFDPIRYGMPPNSLHSIEPLQLLTLEAVRLALDDAGYATRPFDREHTSVILGISGVGDVAHRYSFRSSLPMFFGDSSEEIISHFKEVLPEWTEDSFPGILTNVTAGRVANRFDFGGANFTVDGACASSLVALHLGVKELESRTSHTVIVGGADCMQNAFTYLAFARTQALSASGVCRPLDERSDGIVLGEGIAVVVLKRLEDAQRDGDRVYAVIKGVGASSDGKDKSLTAPRKEGQVRALRRAYEKADVSPSTVELIEAHATGTAVGDRTEMEALSEVLRTSGSKPQGCAVGSVKSMVGHTKAASGLAGLIKAALALYHKTLPPTLGVETPLTDLRLADSPLYVNTDTRPWVQGSTDHPRRAGVSGFGFGGTNFHVVLEEVVQDSSNHERRACFQEWPHELLVWKAQSRADLLSSVCKMKEGLAHSGGLSLAERAFRRATENEEVEGKGVDAPFRLAVVASSIEDLRQKLVEVEGALENSCAQLQNPEGVYFSEKPLLQEGEVAFLFPGEGAGYVDMLRDLAIYFPEVRERFERSNRVLGERLPKPLSRFIFPPPPFSSEEREGREAAFLKPGIEQPASGTASLAIYHLLRSLSVTAEMFAGHRCGEFVALATAGVLDEDDLIALLEARGRSLEGSDSAQSSKNMETLLQEFVLRAPRGRVFSNERAAPYPADTESIARCLIQHPVGKDNLVGAIEAMYEEGARVFVEVGPGSHLSGLVDQILGERPHLSVACDEAGRSGVAQLFHAIGQLAVHGVDVKTAGLFQGRMPGQTDLRTSERKDPETELPAGIWLVDGARARPGKEATDSGKPGPVVPLEFRTKEEKPVSESTPLRSESPRAQTSAETPVGNGTTAFPMIRYQKMMQRFLDTQKGVMLTYLQKTMGDGAGSGEASMDLVERLLSSAEEDD